MDWIQLTKSSQLEDLIAESQEKAVVIFKNSTRCFISKFALKNFQSSFSNSTHVSCYMVDVVADRLISLEIAEVFKVEHQSPQILIVSKGQAVFNTSHESIDGAQVEKLLLRL
ncbi:MULTISPECIES: bacillithiol system redox-active protein YtxJ [Myroides]|uniref:Bacillithiol system redox-active protein YtxJ n=1 Tax=Myroides albus TaxID=2562892 RepID=A0A6I3LG14_9FLAO|nr:MULTISPECIES: bacillithiol system redox-active protein YtxJ [Myroides]MTG98439.1 bacillithiol system redox-active protein YtxJ [Myroides albus]MVX35041.1 bacillithiol system redox-active protein YtxJ [Myroides sp. LoEW2-1]UVD79648.1 bacillithiol system redox-active protein YtxJ [Myroides albus]